MGTAEPEIRTAGVVDAAVLEALRASSLGGAWSLDSMTRLLRLPGAVALIATVGGVPAGACLATPAGEEAEVAFIAVSPEHRRTGVGRRLLQVLADRVRETGFGALLLEVAETNTAAIALYAGFGFETNGRRPNYYSSDGAPVDAILMRFNFYDLS